MLEHVSVHTGELEGFDNTKRDLLPLGVPFGPGPTRGTGKTGCEGATLWIGGEACAFVWPTRPGGEGWRAERAGALAGVVKAIRFRAVPQGRRLEGSPSA